MMAVRMRVALNQWRLRPSSRALHVVACLSGGCNLLEKKKEQKATCGRAATSRAGRPPRIPADTLGYPHRSWRSGSADRQPTIIGDRHLRLSPTVVKERRVCRCLAAVVSLKKDPSSEKAQEREREEKQKFSRRAKVINVRPNPLLQSYFRAFHRPPWPPRPPEVWRASGV